MDLFATGPFADFITTAPRDLTPSLVKSDDTGDTYHLGTLSFHLKPIRDVWVYTRICLYEPSAQAEEPSLPTTTSSARAEGS
jgi:hypothetical protein